MQDDSRKKLEAFIERASRLEKLSYLEGGERIAGFTVRKMGEGGQIKFFQPTEEKTDALLFNLRLFVQDKDDISFRRIGTICSDPGITDFWKKEYLEIRALLNLKLNGVAAQGNEGKLTYDQLFRMVLFGHMAHRNEHDGANKNLRKWVKTNDEWGMIYNTFHQVVIWVVVAVINLKRASEEELLRQGQGKDRRNLG